MHRDYNSDAWYNQLNNKDISFVTRIKINAQYRVIERRTVLKTRGLTSAQTIELTGAKAKGAPSGCVVLAIKTSIQASITYS